MLQLIVVFFGPFYLFKIKLSSSYRSVSYTHLDMGYSFNAGPELEFFLFQTDDEGKPTTKTNDEAGYFDLGPLDHGESTRREICLTLETMGFEIEASHHEVAAGQHEIDFKYADALTAADNIMTFKMAVKTIAQKNGLHATFMPKPIYGACGSGMHTNMSLFKDGKNIFFDPDGERKLSKEAYSFIAVSYTHIDVYKRQYICRIGTNTLHLRCRYYNFLLLLKLYPCFHRLIL